MYIVYSKPNCTYCEQAKQLLKAKNLVFEERVIDVGQPKVDGTIYVTVDEVRQRAPSAKSVPQIFLDDRLVGGFTELRAELTQ